MAGTAPGVETLPDTGTESQLSPLYRVLIHNDDITPMNFVVDVLKEFFRKSGPEADTIMITAHHTGVAHVATLPLEEAEFRVDQAHSKARAAKYPLTFTYEPET